MTSLAMVLCCFLSPEAMLGFVEEYKDPRDNLTAYMYTLVLLRMFECNVCKPKTKESILLVLK